MLNSTGTVWGSSNLASIISLYYIVELQGHLIFDLGR